MPRKGYSSITVSDEIKTRLDFAAVRTSKTVPKLIEHMLDRVFPKVEAEA